jgi:hypothetical protein
LTTLATHTRGTTFRRTITLGNSYVFANFSALYLTVRTSKPTSTITDDTDAGVIGQATLVSGISQDTTTVGTVTIADEVTYDWPTTRVYWDLVGILTNGERWPLDGGEFSVKADITRTNT